MSCCDAPGLLSFDQALKLLTETPKAQQACETVPLAASLNRINAVDIFAPFNIPNYNNAAMDGYAYNCDNWPTRRPLQLIGKSFAGAAFEGLVGPGECVRIMTGAMVPKGCNCVVMQEYTEVNGHHVFVTREVHPGDNIRPAGNDVHQGQMVLRKGSRIGPRAIGMLATLGYAGVEVYQPLKVALFSTGNEIVPLGTKLDEGFIYDSNRYLIEAALKNMGIEVTNLGVLPDNPKSIEENLLLATTCDAVITSGGISVGEADFTREVMNKIGDITFYKLAMKPGKPFAFGSLSHPVTGNKALFFGLPGNPVSAAVTFHLLATPALKTIAGERLTGPFSVNALCQSDLSKKPGRRDFQRGRLSRDQDGTLLVHSTGNQSSGALLSLLEADCYICLEQDRGNVACGETVSVIPLMDNFA